MENKGSRLKRMIVERNTTQEAVASVLGMDRSTLYRKTKGGLSSLTLREARAITDYLRLSEAEARKLFWE